MNQYLRVCFVLLAVGFIQASRSAPEPATFVASTPCDLIPRVLLTIPTDTDCEFIKWKLTLQVDAATKTPGRFTLDYTYGMTLANTTGFVNGGGSKQKTGVWRITQDTRNRTIYQLVPDSSGEAIALVNLDNKLLHLLDQQGRLMIGHGGWSYTLNKQ
ncbi:hypothetical protein [Fibrivirga algicola]|uniref:Copper resistance protein NlpE n=1 Tax=Fibrivirga algicola TaxID=2950420 RepID=A0ABX0QBA3_9BACT|nr:hypothetical protein [Fibrivirga algicola]ARK11119.1 hypothetical protein A6C57_12735 [Fibrella sp. ES10-3-2-2]NID09611.1 hypothetical protein [Fibrivirga algicola]